MRNFKIVIQYEGTRYQGWQRQGTTQNTLQGKFEALLSKIAGTPVEIQASGRTDARCARPRADREFPYEYGAFLRRASG